MAWVWITAGALMGRCQLDLQDIIPSYPKAGHRELRFLGKHTLGGPPSTGVCVGMGWCWVWQHRMGGIGGIGGFRRGAVAWQVRVAVV